MKRMLNLSMLVILVLVVAACGANSGNEDTTGEATDPEPQEANETVTIQHELGETPVEKNPETVVVFDFGSLDTLDKLGVDIAALPKTNIPSYLSKFEADEYVNVGSLKEPDFEKIHELQPDLIVISGRQQDLYEDFQEIAPTIYLAVDTTNYMASFKENVTTLGEIFDKEAEVEAELANIDEMIEQLHEKATASGKNALITLANDGKVSAYGPGSRFGIIHDVFGFAPVDENIEASTHGQSISFEYIVEKDPDYLFVIDRGAAIGGESGAKQLIENELVENTKAYQDDHIVYLDPDFWYLSGGGLVSVAEMVKEVDSSLE